MSKALEEKMEKHMENCKGIWRISSVRWEEILGRARLKKQMLQKMKYIFNRLRSALPLDQKLRGQESHLFIFKSKAVSTVSV